ncbi:MAG: carboxypeptidase regulatory-like domain-containing protein [Bryobacteraceae bacterium]
MSFNRYLAVAAAALLAAACASAQNVSGTIVGSITDISGGAMAGAKVTITNEETGIESVAATGAAGEYVAPNLPPGTYAIRTEAAGFKPSVVKGIRLLANRTVRSDIAMQPGELTQSIEIRATAAVVSSENATIGNVLDSSTIRQLPLNGRTLDRLIRISAGVTTDSANNPRVAGSAYWGGIQFNVDGVTYNDVGNGGGSYSYRNGLATLPSVDAVSEFKIDSNNQKAEYEGSVSATVVTKTGTNDFHGSVLWFNRNKAYAAKNFFATALAKAPFNRNEFGYTIGGPVIKNKTFFFHSYEGLRERTSRTNTLSVGTEAMRNGNFAGLPTIVDPLAGVPFANNQVPATRIDPRSKALIEWVPVPNQGGTGPAGTLSNYVVNLSNVSDVNRWGLRVDHRFSSSDSIWVNLNYSKGKPYFVAQGYPPRYGSWENGGYSTQSMNLTHVHTFSPAMLNEFRFGYLRHASVRQGMNKDFNPLTLFPTLYPVSYGGLPYMGISSHTAIGDYGGSDLTPQLTPQYIDSFSYVRGKHTIKAGVDFANHRAASFPAVGGMGSGLANDGGLGRFTFNGRYTYGQTTGSAQPAHAYADFLLGYPVATYRSTTSANMLFYTWRYSAYIQDDWQVTPRLTLNFGLRYMVQTAWKERNRTQAQFDFASGKLVVPGDSYPAQAQQKLVDAYPITTTSKAGLSESLYDTDKNNFSPRVGFAFRPFGGNRTVVRGGAGVYYNFIPVYIGFRQLGFSNPPFLLAETYEAAAGVKPSLTLAQPFLGAGMISPNPGVTAVQRNIRNSESYQWNFTLEREVRANLGVRASYVGNHSTHLPWYNYPANNPLQQAAGALQPRRPYQPWADILLLASGGDSILHQLQLEAVQRYSNGLSFQVEYSWTRSLDNVPVVGGPQNPYNQRADRGNSDQIRRHIFTAAYSYELPFGKGKKWANAGGPLNHIVGGWQIGGITYLRTGPPFSPSFTATQAGWMGGRPDQIGEPKLSRGERSIYRWFNAAAFAVPAPFTYGNASRNLLFVPGEIVFDISVLKDVRLMERVSTQFRAEFFNMPNHANFGGPASNISVSNVGRITSAGDPRQIQFGLKVLF